jgi:hypothetical protein
MGFGLLSRVALTGAVHLTELEKINRWPVKDCGSSRASLFQQQY